MYPRPLPPVPPADAPRQASRQAALHKALSTAYLNHQIAELENRVNAAHIKSPAPQAKAKAKGGDSARSPDASARQLQPQPQPPQQPPGDPNDDLGRPDDVEIDVDDEAEDWRVVVVDISALMWAKNAVKRLMAKGWEVIIPAEGAFKKSIFTISGRRQVT